MALRLRLPFKTFGASSTPDVSGNGFNAGYSSSYPPIACRGPVPSIAGCNIKKYPEGNIRLVCSGAASGLGDTFTLAMWINILGEASLRIVPCGFGVTDTLPWMEIARSGSAQIQLRRAGLLNAFSAAPSGFNFSIWHHYVWSRQSYGHNALYIDGTSIAVDSSADTEVSTGSDLYFGDRASTASLPSAIGIADARVYTTGLTAAEARGIFCESMKDNAALLMSRGQ